jgi:hypothetical protein
MKSLFLKYKNHLVLILVVLSVVLFLFGGKTQKPPTIKALSPLDRAQNVDLRSSIYYSSDNPLILSEITISSSPSLDFELNLQNTNTLVATHKLAFQPSTTYTISLSWKGEDILNHTFTTLKSQEDPLLIQNMKEELERDYPLAQKLPLKTAQYRVVYSSPLTLEITLINPNFTSEEIIEDVKSWVTQNGGDVSVHKFVMAAP